MWPAPRKRTREISTSCTLYSLNKKIVLGLWLFLDYSIIPNIYQSLVLFSGSTKVAFVTKFLLCTAKEKCRAAILWRIIYKVVVLSGANACNRIVIISQMICSWAKCDSFENLLVRDEETRHPSQIVLLNHLPFFSPETKPFLHW